MNACGAAIPCAAAPAADASATAPDKAEGEPPHTTVH
jgi:hypothetical protein